MSYIDGFVLTIAKDRMDEYKTIVKTAAQAWKDHGALEYIECVGDDLGTEKGTRSFVEMTNATENDNVIFGWVVFESKEARDIANEKVAADPRMANLINPEDNLFEPLKMAYGGFKIFTAAD